MKLKHLLIIGVLLIAGFAITYGFRTLQQPDTTVQTLTTRWSSSAHADRSAEAFIHWDEEEPPVIPMDCAKCHSELGYLDYLGEDGSAPGSVDSEANPGTVVSCNACHNESAHQKSAARFPSGMEITGLGSEALCMECHQGTRAGANVDRAVSGMDDDAVSEELGFINVHYAIAAATQMGDEAQGGYQYAGKAYVGRFEHTETMQTCTDCHDAHALTIEPQACSPCHLNVVDGEDFHDIRDKDTADFDGDGDSKEGVAGEIATLHRALYEAMQSYTTHMTAKPVAYSEESYPYFFNDSNGDGEVNPEEANFGNQYKSWTPRLLRAAYNYQFVKKDPGAYAHNPEYALQLLYDSMEDLGQKAPVDLQGMLRP